MENYYHEFLSLVAINIFALISPGPDFAIIVRQSIVRGRRAAFITSLGIGAAIVVHLLYCLLGLGYIVSKSIVLFNLIKFLGAAYLIVLGIKSLRSKPSEQNSLQENTTAQEKSTSGSSDFKIGFITNLLNPKATLFFLSVFSVVISPDTPIALQAFYGFWMVANAVIWFMFVAIFFTHERVRAAFLRFGHWFERITGAILIALGLKIAVSD